MRSVTMVLVRADSIAGAYVVDLAQPQGRLAKAFLEPNPAFDTCLRAIAAGQVPSQPAPRHKREPRRLRVL